MEVACLAHRFFAHASSSLLFSKRSFDYRRLGTFSPRREELFCGFLRELLEFPGRRSPVQAPTAADLSGFAHSARLGCKVEMLNWRQEGHYYSYSYFSSDSKNEMVNSKTINDTIDDND